MTVDTVHFSCPRALMNSSSFSWICRTRTKQNKEEEKRVNIEKFVNIFTIAANNVRGETGPLVKPIINYVLIGFVEIKTRGGFENLRWRRRDNLKVAKRGSTLMRLEPLMEVGRWWRHGGFILEKEILRKRVSKKFIENFKDSNLRSSLEFWGWREF